MTLREPLRLLVALGGLCWPVGVFAFGGFGHVGGIIIGVGSAVVLASFATELLLRLRDRRQEQETLPAEPPTAPAGGPPRSESA